MREAGKGGTRGRTWDHERARGRSPRSPKSQERPSLGNSGQARHQLHQLHLLLLHLPQNLLHQSRPWRPGGTASREYANHPRCESQSQLGKSRFHPTATASAGEVRPKWREPRHDQTQTACCCCCCCCYRVLRSRLRHVQCESGDFGSDRGSIQSPSQAAGTAGGISILLQSPHQVREVPPPQLLSRSTKTGFLAGPSEAAAQVSSRQQRRQRQQRQQLKQLEEGEVKEEL